MKMDYPELPKYEFSWRSIQIEPIPSSGERITLGTIVKGADKSLIAAKLISAAKLKSIYGLEFSKRMYDALSLCVQTAESFYEKNPLTVDWLPPLEGFFIGHIHSSLAENIEEGLLRAAMHCSSFSVSYEAEKTKNTGSKSGTAPELWRKNILKAVTISREDFIDYFEKSVPIRGKGLALTFDFLSTNYAAQFDAVAEVKGIQPGLIRAQSKLWQLDQLRDARNLDLIKPASYELLIKTPVCREDNSDISSVIEFTEELSYEAGRRGLSVFSTDSYEVAALHLINEVGKVA